MPQEQLLYFVIEKDIGSAMWILLPEQSPVQTVLMICTFHVPSNLAAARELLNCSTHISRLAERVNAPLLLLGFMRRLSLLPEGSLHLDILRDNIADAAGPLPCANWAGGINRQFATQGLASPFLSSGIGVLDSHGLLTRQVEGVGRLACVSQDCSFQGGQAVHISSLVWPP